jgi:DNA repair protein RecO (recombination protein O)
VELVVTESADRELHHLREVRVERPYLNLSNDVMRGTVALFVQELLVRVLREESADTALFDFLQQALEALDTTPDIAHYPLVLLVELSRHMGIDPEAPVGGEDHFDLREGRFVPASQAHGHVIGPPHSHALAALLRSDLASMGALRIPGPVRRELLDQLLLYYRMHLEGLGELRSPSVLHQVLG